MLERWQGSLNIVCRETLKPFIHLKQLLYLMDMMKNGIRHPNQRLPFVLTTYVSKVAQQMLKPGMQPFTPMEFDLD